MNDYEDMMEQAIKKLGPEMTQELDETFDKLRVKLFPEAATTVVLSLLALDNDEDLVAILYRCFMVGAFAADRLNKENDVPSTFRDVDI